MRNGIRAIAWNGISATPATFVLRGGAYGLTLHAGTWGTATLQRLMPDGSTLVSVMTAQSADGYLNVNLPNGTYQLTLFSISGLIGDLVSIVEDQ
ncbi:hypothetical protein [Bradyrhizobium jicamae]|uniref:hypothetical protein n=1 Tax=Bradyrhizobium jicamae TaxID=280332 RepID=UPI001BAAF391|nr:hypothetical protein [Bradyrhizobium jicamae]MBR0936688.1 hypothetical protein [Bradyrhizobium jicamae]